MSRLPRLLLAAALTVTSLPAWAQLSGPRPRDRNDQGEPLRWNPVPQNNRDAWPRLDPGAAFCASFEDLERRQAANAAAARGSQVEMDADCAVVRAATPITILERRGSGRTRVRITAGGRQGWTDAWLPDRGLPGDTATNEPEQPQRRAGRR